MQKETSQVVIMQQEIDAGQNYSNLGLKYLIFQKMKQSYSLEKNGGINLVRGIMIYFIK